jgi:hypothetical protein
LTRPKIPYQASIGQRFARLVVLDLLLPSSNSPTYRCRCDCGNEILALANNVRRGNTRSCGCFQLDVRTKHGHCRRGRMSSEYSSWENMHARCNQKHNHPGHGGRGIIVCARWADFEIFLADMGPKPSRKHSIERKNNNGNYEPDNCVWATDLEQQRNKSNSQMVSFNGRTQCVAAWAVELNLHKRTLHNRIARGWPIERAFTKPTGMYKRRLVLPNVGPEASRCRIAAYDSAKPD